MTRFAISFALSLYMPMLSVAADPTEPTETVVRMTVQPMPAPKPALKYQLLPELSEMNPGNPVLEYLNCFSEEQSVFFREEATNEREKWLAMPLKDLPVEEALWSIHRTPKPADYAARLETADWQVLARLKRDGPDTHIGEVSQMRLLAPVLKLRFRAEVAKRDFAEAIIAAKTIFALSHHLGEHPTAVGELVGIHIAHEALDTLEEMIEQPGCPNLYWALTNLPDPLIRLDKGVSDERMTFANEFALLDERSPMSDAQVQRVVTSFVQLTQWVGAPTAHKKENKFLDRINALIRNKAGVDAARKRLPEFLPIEAGFDKFPPSQVILLDEKRKYEILRDDVAKLMSLPYWQAEAELAENSKKSKDENESLFASFAADFNIMRMQQVILQQRIALLRSIEALRLYAAEHDGKLPAALADVPVPLPVDPLTGKPFTYNLEGATAKLRGTPPRGKDKDNSYNRRYEITTRK
jgi:hypothetical protein